MKVTFIIPVYKVEKYLDESVESIIKQTYNDFEILLVDDGSPDNCPAICDEWARRDNRIKAFHKANGGLSDARNYGLERAEGDYVVFVDGDDFWKHSDDLQKLVTIADIYPMVDFISYNCDYYYPVSNTYCNWVPYAEVLSSPTEKNKVVCELVKSGTFPMSACLKLLKRQFLIDNNLFFVKGQIAEDIPWFIDVLDSCTNCLFLNEYIYAYRQNVAGSITNSSGDRGFNSLFSIFKTELQKIESRSFSHEAKEAIKSFLAYEYSILLADKKKSKAIINDLYQYMYILNYTMNPKVKMVSRVYRIFGIKITEWVLYLYQIKRSSKK